ncbi:hypothetical protein BDB01DRAFT_800049 [Pilobolus umbonatus]|nr:hypothetical protein BDB01DRAFT_800049 [Pilobolus umbonatus]
MSFDLYSLQSHYGSTDVMVTLTTAKAPPKRKLVGTGIFINKIVRRKRNGSSSSSEQDGREEEEYEEEVEEVNQGGKQNKWACHRKVLLQKSPYFSSLLGKDFIESKASTVSLPGNILTAVSMENILKYMYTDTFDSTNSIKDIFDTYISADYLGMEELCNTLSKLMMTNIHQCTCYCSSCQVSIPTLFPLCRERATEHQDERMGLITEKMMIVLTNDPEKVLPTYWSNRHMAQLLMQMTQDVSQALIHKIIHRVNKFNAIETLFGCYTASNLLSVNDPLLSWSSALHATLTSVQSRATQKVAHNFDFFCSEYPALMSCIDDITYSFDFLEYLLLHILEDQMEFSNAGILYQGIACDLSGRDSVQSNDQVRDILSVAKVIILHYIGRNIDNMRQEGALDKLNEEVLMLLAQDLGVRPKSLISSRHPLSKRGIFSFLIPPIPDLSTSTSEYTNGLSRSSSRPVPSSSRGNTLSNHLKHNKPSIKHRFIRLFKRIMSYNPHVSSSVSIPSKKLPNRYLSTSTARTTASASSAWSQILLDHKNKVQTGITFSQKKKKTVRRMNSSPIVSINRRVRLIRRPNLTVGTVSYVGNVDFAKGIWIGVELDRRVGKNDGSVDGHRYFTTSINRGIFVRPDDVSIVI